MIVSKIAESDISDIVYLSEPLPGDVSGCFWRLGMPTGWTESEQLHDAVVPVVADMPSGVMDIWDITVGASEFGQQIRMHHVLDEKHVFYLP